MRKLASILTLTMSLMLISTTVSYSEESEDSAKALNSIGLVMGSGGDYHVADTLSRAEAVTLILRLIKNNETTPENPNFSDVVELDWFYVAVAKSVELNIVNGYPDGSFKPKDIVSRQAFLKMLLEVLGYGYNEDFTWNEIGNFAAKIGLVDVIAEPTTFIRKDAFDIMVKLLDLEHNNLSKKYIEIMKENELITDGQYDGYFSGEYVKIDTNIDKIIENYITDTTITGSKHVELSFSNKLDESAFAIGNYRIKLNDKTEFFNVEKLDDNKVLLILRNSLVNNDELKITALGSIQDIYGFRLMDGEIYNIALTVEGNPLDELRVESVVSVGNGVIQVLFNQHVDLSDATKYTNYQINDLSEVRPYMTSSRVVATGTNNLKYRQFDIVYDRFIDGNLYYLKTTNVYSLGRGYTLESQQYRFTYNDNEQAFQAVNIESVDLNHFVVTFNQPIKESGLNDAIMKIDGYSVYRRHMDKDSIYKVHVYMLLELVPNKTYYLQIENLVSEYKLEITTMSKSLKTNEVKREDIKAATEVLSNGDYLITFNRMIDAFAKGNLVNINVIAEDNKLITLNSEDYKVLSPTEIIVYKVSALSTINFNSIYLYGDNYYIGNHTVMVKVSKLHS